MTTLSVFNNKGGVGKTTYMFHIAHILSRRGKTVLMVDLDTQGNLTGYCLEDDELHSAWSESGNSVYRVVEPIIRGTGDYEYRPPIKLSKAQGDLYLAPGDLRLSDYEDLLGDTWNSARGGAEAPLRTQTALNRFVKEAAREVAADVVLIDLGPNLGALNRSGLAFSDYFMTPMAPDLFSIQGTENLGNKFVSWAEQWDQIHDSWKGSGLDIPDGKPRYLGYVMQMHNTRNNDDGMTEGWKIYGGKIERAVQVNIVEKIGEGRVVRWDDGDFRLGRIPNLHSLIPYSQAARKPIFDCTGRDGLRGAHQRRARESIDLFEDIITTIEGVVDDQVPEPA